MKYFALIPMRGGSKSIPLKNIKLIAGKPLFYHSIAQAVESKIFDSIFVSTDSELIASKVKEYFPSVHIVSRPAEFAQDQSSTESVMGHFLQNHPCDVLCTIQVTSPLVRASDFQEARKKFESEKLDSLLTAVEFKRFLWNSKGEAINYQPLKRPRRQEFAGCLMENGAFYFTKRVVFDSQKNRLGGKIGIHQMAPESAVEIDEPEDWVIVENLLYRQKKLISPTSIKAVICDVDGTLTDAGMYYDAEGEALKKYNTRDAYGLKMLEKMGIKICIITAEDSPRVHSRMKKLNFKHYFFGINDKLPVLNQWAKEQGLRLEECAYIGDDLGDKECLQAVGLAACPADAVPEIQKICHFQSQFNGGEGAVRDLCNSILLNRS